MLSAILTADAHNLAMPALAVAILVRHLEDVGDALDPYLVEPVIWDGIDPDPTNTTPANEINLCVKSNTFPAGTAYAVADLNLLVVQGHLTNGTPDVAAAWDATTRAAADAAPYACNGITPAITPVVLP